MKMELVSFGHMSLALSICICFLMGTFYVVSLYLWSKQNRFNRNEPPVIRRRFISVLLTCLLCYVSLYWLGSATSSSMRRHSINEWLGLRFDSSLIWSSMCSLGLTMILFSGPIVQHLISQYMLRQTFRAYDSNSQSGTKRLLQALVLECRTHLDDLCFWRNYLISPFTEEFVFRGCMLPLLCEHLGLAYSVFITPLFFGLAHLHHIIEGYFHNDMPLDMLIGQHCFQFTYTYIFGCYSSYLFMRTGNLCASFVSHAFCNCMGFPNVRQLLNDFDSRPRCFIMLSYVIGLATFIWLMHTVTEPSIFSNNVYSF